MTGLIRLLDDHVVSQIAAGEVIEGSDAVLKELVENSLDAGALSITIVLEEGGKQLVRVSDDGFGMSGDDLRMAFKRHSTSKITGAEDLSSVATLGFRGEALAAVASVSKVEALSKLVGETDGHRILIEGGEDKEFSPYGCAEGTVISVWNLFYNTPVRRRFLRSDKNESDKCFRMFRGLALSKPNVEWKYFQGKKIRVHLPGGNLRERIVDLMGTGYLEGLTEVDCIEGRFRLNGFVGDISHTRRSREHQFFFLNGRKINLGKLNYILKDIYQGSLNSGEQPVFFLFLEMEPHEVDLNIHPTKSEVRFHNERRVVDFLRRAWMEALGMKNVIKFIPPRPVSQQGERWSDIREERSKMTPREYGMMFHEPHEKQKRDYNEVQDEQRGEEEFLIPKALFQLERKYIVAQVKNGLVLIDQHAAHERILYESALKAYTKGNAPSQRLVFPKELELSVGEEEQFTELLPHLEVMGFDLTQIGPRIYQILAVPAGLKISDETALLREIFDYYRETEEHFSSAADKSAASFACKVAIKTGDELSPEEMVELIEALHRTSTPFACPHGRPTYLKITVQEFDRRFGRS